MNPLANGECGAWANLNWGSSVQTTTVNPDVLEGWGKRNSDWQFSAGVQHELLPRISVDVNYSRRWWDNFFVTHNRALGPQDYDEVTLTAPLDPRLPDGGGYPVSFLVRNNNSVLGVQDSYYTTTSDFGDETHYWQGVELTVNARLANGLQFQGGTSTGRGVNDTCDVLIGRFGRPMTPSTATTAATGVVDGQPECGATEPWLTTFRGLASYTIPKADVLVSAIVRSQPNVQPGADVATNGASRAANFLMTATQFQAATGRPLRPGVTTETVNLLLPGQLYGERVNNLDMRVAKIVRIKRTRANIGVDFYNLTNANTATTVDQSYIRPIPRSAPAGCVRRRSCSRGSCGSTCRWTSRRLRASASGFGFASLGLRLRASASRFGLQRRSWPGSSGPGHSHGASAWAERASAAMPFARAHVGCCA